MPTSTPCARMSVFVCRASGANSLVARLLAALLAVLAMGCGASMMVRGEVLRPASVPVRTFPRIVVSSAGGEESDAAADRLATHLREGSSDIERVSAERVLELRERGELPLGTAIVSIATQLDERLVPQWAARPGLGCWSPPCTGLRQMYADDIAQLEARLTIVVSDGPSARVLQRMEIDDGESGGDPIGMRLRVLARLTERLLALVDQRTEQVQVELLPIDHPEARAALERIDAGEWSEGRRALEALARGDVGRALDPAQRARLLFDVGQARRFDPSLPIDERLASARRALFRAVRLDPQPIYARALSDLEAHRQSIVLIDQQREATAHNFALVDDARVQVPAPPASYQR
jgi:hypothetical protein